MKNWLAQLTADLARRQRGGLARQLTPTTPRPSPDGRGVLRADRSLLNLASNDYLALAGHPHLKKAGRDAIERFGAGAGGSALVSGHTSLHDRVARRFAAFKHAQAGLLCPTGYQANLAAVTALAGPGDLICIDKLSHASLIDAAKASGATVRVFPHLNLAKLERLLARDPRSASSRRVILTDSIFSMDGDAANLPALCDLAERYDAILIVDEAHGTGVLGETGTGLCEAQSVSERVDVVISTASKALGGLGGIITSPQMVIDTIINHGRSYIYTTAMPPAQAAVIDAALDVVGDEPWRRQRLLELARQVRTQLEEMKLIPEAGHDTSNAAVITPIIPIITGSTESALALAGHLEAHNILAPAIRPPTVPPGGSRVRLSLRADLTDGDVDMLMAALRSWRS